MLLLGAGLVAQNMARSISQVNPVELLPRLSSATLELLPPEISLRGQTFVMAPYYADARQALLSAARSGGGGLLGSSSLARILGQATGYATGAVWSAIGLLAIFFVSLYLAIDGERVLDWIEKKVPIDYRPTYHALRLEIDTVWRRFFRGQLVLAIVVGTMTTAGLLVLGIAYAVPLGIIAGLLEVIPRIGPALSVIPAVIVALVTPSTTFPDLPRLWLAALVVLLYIMIQNLENNILVPRILGSSVNLPPAVMLLGALAGAKLAGIPGILLAAPVMGSIRVLGSWLYDQLTRPEDDVAEIPVEHPEAAPGSDANEGTDGAAPGHTRPQDSV
jgi:predicted PurR-regulated permease PerM